MLFHIISNSDWKQAIEEGRYAPSSLNEEGFIHCSTAEQVVDIANLFYPGQDGLILLCIDEGKVDSPIVFEDLDQLNKLFPHIYGPLNVDAVVKVVDFAPESDGAFALPDEVRMLI